MRIPQASTYAPALVSLHVLAQRISDAERLLDRTSCPAVRQQCARTIRLAHADMSAVRASLRATTSTPAGSLR